LRRLADAEQDAGAEELAEALHQSAEQLRQRPQAEAHGQQDARTKPVDHGAGRQLRERIGPEESREQITHVRDGETELFADQRIGDGQGRPVDVIDHTCEHQQRQRETLNQLDAWRRQLHSGHRFLMCFFILFQRAYRPLRSATSRAIA
jgi:hypothetical protein